MDALRLFPRAASGYAQSVDLLFLTILALASLIALGVFALIAYFAVKYRRRSEDELPEQMTGGTRLEIAWTVIPLILGIGFFFWAARLYTVWAQPPQDTLNVYVVAKQWMWKLQQPTAQTEINQLHIPVGKPVRLTMISEDVIHSFFVPDMRVKADVLPGRYTTLWFQPDKAGEYHLFCALYCGTNHSNMVGTIYVMQPADYQAWLAGGGTASQSPAATGAALFQQYGCAACHQAGSQSRAPDLTGVYGKPVLLSDGTTVVADDSYIHESIVNPRAKIVAGYQPIMPAFQGQLTEDQLLALIQYVKSLGTQQGGQTAPGGAQPPTNASGGASPATPVTPSGSATPAP